MLVELPSRQWASRRTKKCLFICLTGQCFFFFSLIGLWNRSCPLLCLGNLILTSASSCSQWALQRYSAHLHKQVQKGVLLSDSEAMAIFYFWCHLLQSVLGQGVLLSPDVYSSQFLWMAYKRLVNIHLLRTRTIGAIASHAHLWVGLESELESVSTLSRTPT